jgi:hypothetical protein
MSNPVEIVIFDVKRGKEKEFEEGAKIFAEFITKQEGYIRKWYFREKFHSGRYIHCTEYSNRELGEHIIEKYKQEIGLEKFNNFFAMLRRMPVIEWHEVWLPEF